MGVTPGNVQALLDNAVINLEETTLSGVEFIKRNGKDWTKWPKTSSFYKAFHAIMTARQEVGELIAPVLRADFTWKQ